MLSTATDSVVYLHHYDADEDLPGCRSRMWDLSPSEITPGTGRRG